MKKTTILVLLILFASVNGFGQPKQYNPHYHQHKAEQSKHAVRLGINGAFFGSENIAGHTVGADYSYNINGGWAISGRVMTGWGRKLEAQSQQELFTSFSGSLTARWTPWETEANWFSLEAGFLYQNVAQATNTLANVASFAKNNLYGIIYTLNARIYQNEKIMFGVRADMLSSFFRGYNIDSYQAGLFFGYKF